APFAPLRYDLDQPPLLGRAQRPPPGNLIAGSQATHAETLRIQGANIDAGRLRSRQTRVLWISPHRWGGLVESAPRPGRRGGASNYGGSSPILQTHPGPLEPARTRTWTAVPRRGCRLRAPACRLSACSSFRKIS